MLLVTLCNFTFADSPSQLDQSDCCYCGIVASTHSSKSQAITRLSKTLSIYYIHIYLLMTGAPDVIICPQHSSNVLCRYHMNILELLN